MKNRSMTEQLKEGIAFIEKELGEFPLGANWQPPSVTEHRRGHYELWAHISHKQLVRLEKIVYSFAPDFSTFIRMISDKHLLVAHRREVLRAYGYECFEDTIEEEFGEEEETNGGKEVAAELVE